MRYRIYGERINKVVDANSPAHARFVARDNLVREQEQNEFARMYPDAHRRYAERVVTNANVEKV